MTILVAILFFILVIGYIYSFNGQMMQRTEREGFEQEYMLPKLVWTHWDTNRPPKIIRDILENREKAMKGWELIFITDDTMYEYVDKKDIPQGYYNLSAPHRADWIRLYVLHKYGGVWMDAGIIVNDVKAMDLIYEETKISKSEYTGFYPNDGINSKGYPSYIDNWFIMSPIRSGIIHEWLKEYERAIKLGFVEYKRSLKGSGTEFSEYDLNKPNDVYLTAQACLQYVLQKREKRPNIILKHARNTMMKIHADCSLKYNGVSHTRCIQDTILYDPNSKNIPFIKLRKDDRNFDISSYFI